jgi:hypothetical protein
LKLKHTFYCNPKDGKFNFERPLDFKNAPRKIEPLGRCKITVEKYRPFKSKNQLGYLFGGILPFIEQETYDEFMITAEEWRDMFKSLFGEKKYSPCGTFCVVKSMKFYTEDEMSMFIKKVKHWCLHELVLDIPPATTSEETPGIGDYLK